jgi:hypothetical protein
MDFRFNLLSGIPGKVYLIAFGRVKDNIALKWAFHIYSKCEQLDFACPFSQKDITHLIPAGIADAGKNTYY